MRTLVLLAVLSITGLMLAAAPAHAQATRTWVSGVGDDANPCSRTAPCKTFPGAIAKTAAGGEIDVLDPGGFGTVTITKSITIAAEYVGEGGILASLNSGVIVNCSTDPNCTVVLRGLIIDGGPTTSNSLVGVKFIAGKSLIIQNTAIRNFTAGTPNGYGVWFNPSATQAMYLTIDNCSFTTNGQNSGTTGGNVFVNPSGGAGTIDVAIRNTLASNGNFGFGVDASSMTGGGVFMSIQDSQASGNLNAGVVSIAAASGGGASNINFKNVTVSNNGVGVNVKGANATARFGNSIISNNANAFKNTGGTLTTYGTNQIHDNPTSTATPTLAGPS